MPTIVRRARLSATGITSIVALTHFGAASGSYSCSTRH
jgi:hypothetical protein